MASLMPNGKQQFFNAAGQPLAGGKIYTYLAGTSTPKATFSDSAGLVPNANPIILDARGEALMYWSGSYKVALQDALSGAVYTVDNYVTDQGATILAALAASTGAGLVGWIRSATGAIATTLTAWLQRRPVELFDFMTAAQIADCMTGSPTLDATASLQAATNAAGNGTVILPPYPVLLKGSYPSGLARVQDGVKVRSNVTYQGTEGLSEIRLDLSCVVGFTTRLLAAITAFTQAPANIAFYGITFTRPGSVYATSTENTAFLYLGAVNGLRVQRCRFIGWPGDAILLGINDDSALTVGLQTFVQDVDISQNYFDGVNKDTRQAISLLCGVDVHIHHNHFRRTTRSIAPAMPGAIDIEPILTSALVANITIENNVFDDIGGVTGAVAAAISGALTVPAYDIFVRNNTFRNITNTADVCILGKAAPDHTAIASGSPYSIEVSGNTHEAVPSGAFNRRWLIGGVQDVKIFNNRVSGGNSAALLGYDDGTNHYPVKGLYFQGNVIRGWTVEGTIYYGAMYILGGLIGGEISRNVFTDCGNTASGVPASMTVIQFGTGGLQSKSLNILDNTFANSGAFSSTLSFPVYAPAGLINPATITAKRNTFVGLGSYPYNGVESIYSQVASDYYDGFIAIPSTGTPNVSGGKLFTASTGDTFTNFANGKTGQDITILGTSSGAVIQNNANVILSAGANFTLSANKTIKLVNSLAKWYQV